MSSNESQPNASIPAGAPHVPPPHEASPAHPTATPAAIADWVSREAQKPDAMADMQHALALRYLAQQSGTINMQVDVSTPRETRRVIANLISSIPGLHEQKTDADRAELIWRHVHGCENLRKRLEASDGVTPDAIIDQLTSRVLVDGETLTLHRLPPASILSCAHQHRACVITDISVPGAKSGDLQRKAAELPQLLAHLAREMGGAATEEDQASIYRAYRANSLVGPLADLYDLYAQHIPNDSPYIAWVRGKRKAGSRIASEHGASVTITRGAVGASLAPSPIAGAGAATHAVPTNSSTPPSPTGTGVGPVIVELDRQPNRQPDEELP